MTTISVTQKHISEGSARNCKKCPIALAIREMVISNTEITVNKRVVIALLKPFKVKLSHSISDEIYAFIRTFDNGGKVKPFNFELDIPEELLK